MNQGRKAYGRNISCILFCRFRLNISRFYKDAEKIIIADSYDLMKKKNKTWISTVEVHFHISY